MTNTVVQTITEALNTNLRAHLTLYSSQIDLNPATYHYFNARSRGHANGAWEGQISINAVISHHDCRIEFCNLLQTCKQPFVRY